MSTSTSPDVDGLAPPATDRRPGATVWLTGLPSAGKSTIARALASQLRADGRRVELLDGDELRTNLTADLGFSREDRDTNVRRVGFIAGLLARHGVIALVPVIAPYAAARAAVRAAHDVDGTAFIEVHVATPLEVCAERDVKGLYAKQRAGEIHGLTGVDDPYEIPTNPEVRLDTQGRSVEEAATLLLNALTARGIA
ncbi:MAG TPA: adenylyl-sulfate kinase [Acidothermaceae bacterium]